MRGKFGAGYRSQRSRGGDGHQVVKSGVPETHRISHGSISAHPDPEEAGADNMRRTHGFRLAAMAARLHERLWTGKHRFRCGRHCGPFGDDRRKLIGQVRVDEEADMIAFGAELKVAIQVANGGVRYAQATSFLDSRKIGPTSATGPYDYKCRRSRCWSNGRPTPWSPRRCRIVFIRIRILKWRRRRLRFAKGLRGGGDCRAGRRCPTAR